jgi:hypothetical protein
MASDIADLVSIPPAARFAGPGCPRKTLLTTMGICRLLRPRSPLDGGSDCLTTRIQIRILNYRTEAGPDRLELRRVGKNVPEMFQLQVTNRSTR